MISQLIRVRNAFVGENDPKAFGYLVGEVHGYKDLIVAWIDGTVEGDLQHKRNLAWQHPAVFLTNE